MTPRYLLDTDIFIRLRQQRPTTLVSRVRNLEPGEAGISLITYGELIFGAHKSTRSANALLVLEELFYLIPPVALPVEAGREYGMLRADLERRGKLIGSNDLWIAAHAMASGLVLVTGNEREFRRIAGLKVENWATE